MALLPPWIVLDPLLHQWLQEDIGRGDRAALSLGDRPGRARWTAKGAGRVAGLPVAARIFRLLDERVHFRPQVAEGATVQPGEAIAELEGPLAALLMGERPALNLCMRLSGIATATVAYVAAIADLPTRFADTRKTTPGLRLLEKYATQVGGGVNHRLGLDDMAMLKDNHIAAAGSLEAAVVALRRELPYPCPIEVEIDHLDLVGAAVSAGVEVIMLDNMDPLTMAEAVRRIRAAAPAVRIEASGNVTLDTIRAVAESGVDIVSSSAPISRAPWLDISMKLL